MFSNLRFSPGSLVLVKYSTYPIWPATVERNATPGYTRFVDIYPNRLGDQVIAYWVVFAGDTEGGWVAADHVVPYHPDLACLVQVSERNSWHRDQHYALSLAKRQYESLVTSTDNCPTLADIDKRQVDKLRRLTPSQADNADIFPTLVSTHHADPHSNQEHNKTPSPESESKHAARSNAPSAKTEPYLTDALTYHPPKSTPRAKQQRKPRNKKRDSRSRRQLSVQQELGDLRECLRRRDAKIAKLTKERRQMRVNCSSRVRHFAQQKEDELARIRKETRDLQKSREIVPTSRIPSLEQWDRASNPASFKQIAGRLQNKYAAFCGGVRRYAKALEDLKESRSTLSNVYRDLREQAHIAEVDIIEAEKILCAFGDILKDLRFSSSSEDAVVLCE